MLELKNINLSFGNNEIFKDFSLTVQNGEKIAISGRSGLGKTSILMMLLGFLKPQSGEISVDNLMMNKQNIKKIRQKTAWLPQNYNVLGSGKVSGILDFLFSFHLNKQSVPDKATIESNLKLLDLSCDIIDNTFENISGGERQRIGLMICKLLNREIIILDEPTSALDKESIALVSGYILSDSNATVVSVSHEDDWLKNCSRIIEIENGN